MVINEKQKETIIKYVPNAQKYIDSDNLYELELAIDEQITENGMDKNGDLTNLGMKLQRLYDQIYNQN